MNRNVSKKQLLLLFIVPVALLAAILIAGHLWNGSRQSAPPVDTISKLNPSLPNPTLKETDKSKLEMYMAMQQDSAAAHNKMDAEPAKRFFDPGPPDEGELPEGAVEKETSAPGRRYSQQRRRMKEQLAKLYDELEKHPAEADLPSGQAGISPPAAKNAQIGQLEQMMQQLQSGTGNDPEISRLYDMVARLENLQNPATNISERKQDTSRTALPISSQPETYQRTSTVFYGLESGGVPLSRQKMAIRAVVHDDQTVQDGSTIRLRLLENIYIGQQEIPANTLIYGVCKLSDERLVIDLDRMIYNNTIYPVKLLAYDADGIEGISIPGAINRDAAKEGIDRTIQTLNMTSMDPSVAAQATTAGIQSLKGLLSKKAKLVRVTLKAGHQVYLQ